MKGRREEAEVIVRLDQLEDCVHICVSAWPAMARKMARLYGPSLDGRNPERSARWVVPVKCISFRRIRAKTPRRIGGFALQTPQQKAVSQSKTTETTSGRGIS